MSKPSKKEIRANIEKLKAKDVQSKPQIHDQTAKLPPKHSSQRIRKQSSI